MRGIAIVVALLVIAPVLHADPLTQADREQLLDKLQKIQDAADAKVDERFKIAVAAFKTGMSSDTAAIELYLRCVEKVQFEDQHKKAQDFREFKRKEEGKFNDPGFRCALRHQLQWLVLTLQVASSKKPTTAFAPEAMAAVDDVFADIEKLETQHNQLRQGVMGSVFAQAYDLSNVAVKEWPGSPLSLESIYDKVVMPPLRKTDKIEALRSAWMKRIRQQGLMIEKWSKPGDADRPAPKTEVTRSPDYEKFVQETYPDLLWQEEVDVFQAGDQRGAALHMFQHLEKYAGHAKAPEWARQFKDLLAPTASPVPPAATKPADS